MSRKATVSLLCTRNLHGDYSLGHGRLVKNYIAYLESAIGQVLPSAPDLIILPEACDRYNGLTTEQQIAYRNEIDGMVRNSLSDIAKNNYCYIAYSASRPYPDDGAYPRRNSTQLIARDGSIAGIYDKNHCTIGENEGGIGYSDRAQVIETDFGALACAICFDLNFDELVQKYIPQKPDLIVFCSQYHGGLRQQFWAYACRAHFAGAIADDRGSILSPFGETLAHTTNYYNHVTHTVNLNCALAHIDYNRQRFIDAKRKYGNSLTVYDPGHVGSVMLTCEEEGLNVRDIMAEFEIESLDDYFERARSHRHGFFQDHDR